MAAARARGRKSGRRPKLTTQQARQIQRLYDEGEHTVAQIAEMFRVPRSTVYGHLDKATIGKRLVPTATGAAPTRNDGAV
jgi:DNA invertase Pin-like site-specific DNA recombinase